MLSRIPTPSAEPLLRRTLQEIWGYSDFRSPQREIMQAILEQRDVLAILPTGAGKSLCFQLPAIVRPGLTLVLSPLVALMENQVQELRDKGVAAGLLHSQISSTQRRQVLKALDDQRLKLLYVSPETLLSRNLWLRLCNADLKLNGIVLDEAHCLVQWGSSFRPAYERLGAVRRSLMAQRRNGEFLPIAAFTATADLPTQRLLIKTLQLQRPEIFQQNIYRSNLNLTIQTVWTPRQRRQQTLRFIRSRGKQSGLIYVRTRRESESLAEELRGQGLNTVAYHGGLGDRRRRQIEQDWLCNRLPFVICTSAFGMGINKANVRWILHYQMPLLLSEYVQEVGRGGRDGFAAEALALVSEPSGILEPSDRQRDQFFTQQITQQTQTARSLLQQLPAQGSVEEIERRFPEGAIALALLHRLGKVRWIDPFHYRLAVGSRKLASQTGTLHHSATTRSYIQRRQCRWQTLLTSFGCDPMPQDCGHCDVCRQRQGLKAETFLQAPA